MGAGLIDDSIIFYPYHFVRTILSIPFCPIPFCPHTILSIPFCPYHFVRYHFVRSPLAFMGVHLQSRWCISHYFRFPHLLRIFQSRKFFSNFSKIVQTFFQKCVFCSHSLRICNFPRFLQNLYFSPISNFFKFHLCFSKFTPDLVEFTSFLHALRVFHFPPTLTMMHLCVQCRYWTPLGGSNLLFKLHLC